MRIQHIACLVSVLALVAAFIGACADPGVYIPVVIERAVAVTVFWGNPETEPTSVYIEPSACPGPDSRDNLRGHVMLSKMEIDFGDGSSWIDATSCYQSASRLKHTFPAAGTYYVRARATYWDGEVVPLGSVEMPKPPKAVTVPWPYDYPWHEP